MKRPHWPAAFPPGNSYLLLLPNPGTPHRGTTEANSSRVISMVEPTRGVVPIPMHSVGLMPPWHGQPKGTNGFSWELLGRRRLPIYLANMEKNMFGSQLIGRVGSCMHLDLRSLRVIEVIHSDICPTGLYQFTTCPGQSSPGGLAVPVHEGEAVATTEPWDSCFCFFLGSLRRAKSGRHAFKRHVDGSVEKFKDEL